MSPPSKKQLSKGFYGFESDDAEFLKIDRDPFDTSASGHGANAKFDDDYGYRAGQGEYSDELDDGLKLQNRLPDEQRAVSDKMRDILDDVDGMGSCSVITGGGGALSNSPGVGSGPPKYRPKTGPRTDAHLLACRLIRQRRNSGAPHGFNDRIVYPKLVY
jgi:hypothetical protein